MVPVVLIIAIHGLFDFALLSGTAFVYDQTVCVGATAPLAAYVVLAVVLLVGRHRIEPAPASA